MMLLLAIDLGTKCGWCRIMKNGERFSGVLNLTPKKNSHPGERYASLTKNLEALEVKPLVVYYEKVRRHQGVLAAHVYGGLKATLEAWCFGHGIPCLGLEVAEIKKHATGKGNADKAMMIRTAEISAGRKMKDDNEADAWWIGDLAFQFFADIA